MFTFSRAKCKPDVLYLNLLLCLPAALQTDEERQQALTAQAFLSSAPPAPPSGASSSGSGASVPAFPSPPSSSDQKPKLKRGQRKKQNEKYRLKYLRLRKAARTMIFVRKLFYQILTVYRKEKKAPSLSVLCLYVACVLCGIALVIKHYLDGSK